jgi:D-amino peptidase
MKIYLCVDMEGHSGIVSWSQVDPSHPHYTEGQRLMAGDVNAVIDGAFEGGATEVYVNDLHGMGRNFHIPVHDLHPRARAIRGSRRGSPRLACIDEDMAAVFCVGYHARASTAGAVLAHTMEGKWARVTANGVEIGETGIEAAIAGRYGVPVTFVSGDDFVCREARELLGDELVTWETKRGLGHERALCLPLEESREGLRAAARKAVGAAERVQPLDLGSPVEVRITCTHPEAAEAMLDGRPQAQRIDELTVAHRFIHLGQWYSHP